MRALNKKSERVESLYYLGEAYNGLKKYDIAIEYLNEYINKNSHDALNAHHQRGLAYYELASVEPDSDKRDHYYAKAIVDINLSLDTATKTEIDKKMLQKICKKIEKEKTVLQIIKLIHPQAYQIPILDKMLNKDSLFGTKTRMHDIQEYHKRLVPPPVKIHFGQTVWNTKQFNAISNSDLDPGPVSNVEHKPKGKH